MPYVYFVSYAFSDAKGNGHGSCETKLDRPITSYAQVQRLAADFRRDLGMSNVAVLNWILLSGPTGDEMEI